MSSEFPGSLVVEDLVSSTAVARVTAVAQVRSLDWECLYAVGVARKEKDVFKWDVFGVSRIQPWFSTSSPLQQVQDRSGNSRAGENWEGGRGI